jgi:hypothetical protein
MRVLLLRLWCRVWGHDDEFTRADGVLRLRCLNCGRKTAGWWCAGSVPGLGGVLTAATFPAGKVPEWTAEQTAAFREQWRCDDKHQ